MLCYLELPKDFFEPAIQSHSGLSNIFYNLKLREDIIEWIDDQYVNGVYSSNCLVYHITASQHRRESSRGSGVDLRYHDFDDLVDFKCIAEFQTQEEATLFKLRWC